MLSNYYQATSGDKNADLQEMALKSHLFISFFEPEQALRLCEIAIIEYFPTQKVIFEEGEVPDYLYLVLHGEVELRKHIGSNQHQTIAKALPNEFFGDFAFLDGQLRSAQALVCGGTTLAKIPCHSLMEILPSTKSTAVLKLFSYIIQRIRTTNEAYVKQLIHKEKMVMVGEMLNTVIHDLKSPLSSIYLSTGMVKELHPDEETAEWCDLIKVQAQRMTAMAEELLEFSRGCAVLNKQPLNLALLLQHFHKLNCVYFQEAQVEFIIDAADLVVAADQNKLLRVLQNLACNAVEAFNGCGGRLKITTWANEKEVEIKICDNGPGIPEEIRERFFEPFVTYGKRGGTGLGTAIAKSIIDAHGGHISFLSNNLEGTTFDIRLPL